MKTTELNVGHKLLSTLWLILQACWPTIECHVYQFVPGTSISTQFVSILVIILPLIQVLHSLNGDHPSKDLRNWFIALSFCSPIRNTSQRMFEHVLPCRRATQSSLREVCPTLVILQLLHQKFVIRIFWYSSKLISFGLHSRWVHPKYAWSRNDVSSSRSTFFINFFHMGAICFFCPATLMSSHIYW